ncbi:MAG: type VI secretion system baseplate subunit TssE [Desulfobacteraceae bacterium]|nr:type VI secretion system baseplate subunit TssE [Desulfobacteraceae bacterium]
MFELTLLERIKALESKQTRAGKNPVEVETRSIVIHLNKLLNTNRGSVLIARDFGMPDMTAFSSEGIAGTMEKIAKAVIELVRKYEKRLSKIKVKIESDKSDVLSIFFTLEGVLSRHDNVPVFFQATVKPGGRITITR